MIEKGDGLKETGNDANAVCYRGQLVKTDQLQFRPGIPDLGGYYGGIMVGGQMSERDGSIRAPVG